jgi:hypothetical protein
VTLKALHLTRMLGHSTDKVKDEDSDRLMSETECDHSCRRIYDGQP